MKEKLLYLFLVFSLPLLAQENILLQGVVETDTVETSQINIINLTQKTGTTSAEDGSFEINVRENDTILFSAVQFQVVKVKITSDILQKKMLRVQLKILVNVLEEVPLSNINLTGNLSTDLSNIKVFNQAAIGFPHKKYNRPTGIGKIYGSYTSSPFMLLINTVNGNLKRLERAGEIIKFDKIVDRGLNAVSVSFYTDELNIPENEIFEFVNFCAQNDEFEEIVGTGNLMDLIYFYYREAPLFINRLPAPILRE